MSRANNPIKVLQTALGRVEKGWTQGQWVRRDGDVVEVCLEGAIYGYCEAKHVTAAQAKAIEVVREIIQEYFPTRQNRGQWVENTDELPPHLVIPHFNDHSETAKDEVLKVIKLAIIRLETEELEAELVEEVEEIFETA